MEFNTTLWQDFNIANEFGISAIEDTYKKAYSFVKDNYKDFTELVIVLNWQCWNLWDRHEKSKDSKFLELSNKYSELFYKARKKFYDVWAKNKEACRYFFTMTD